MIGGAAHSQRDAGMLDRAIVIDQERTDCAHIRLLGVVGQGLKPIGIYDFRVVVEENKQLSRGGCRSIIVSAREIEFARELDSTDRIALHQIQRNWIARLVVHHDDFEIRIGRFFEDALQAVTEHVRGVAGRNDDANTRIALLFGRDNL